VRKDLSVRADGLTESVLAALEDTLVALQVGTLVGDFVGLGGDVLDLLVGHAVDDQGREGVLGEVVEQVTLDDLVGDGGDEVGDFVLWTR
jgi:hypothetical protein